MTSDVHTASPDTTLAEALSITRAHRIRHLPVLDGGQLVGLVSDRDLRLAIPPAWAAQHEELLAALHKRYVRELMAPQVITVRSDTPVEDAARMLYTHRIGCLPVMDDDQLVGILTETDLLRSFTELFGSADDTTRVEARMPNRPGEIARVVRLIGIEHRINIAGMVVPPVKDSDECVAIMHLQTTTPQAVIHALRKVGYRVGSPSLETDPNADLIPTEDFEEPPHGMDPTRRRAHAEL